MVGKKRGGRSEWEERGLPLSRGKPPLVGVRRGRVHSSLDAPFLRRPGCVAGEGGPRLRWREGRNCVFHNCIFAPSCARWKERENAAEAPTRELRRARFPLPPPLRAPRIIFPHENCDKETGICCRLQSCWGFSAFQGGFFGCFCAFPCFSFSSSPFLPFGRGCIVSAFSPLPSPLPAARFVSATQVWLLSEKREMADAEKKGENGGSRKLGKNRRRRRRRCVCATRRRPRGRKRKKRKSASEERNRDRAIKSEGGKRKRRKRDFLDKAEEEIVSLLFSSFFLQFLQACIV